MKDNFLKVRLSEKEKAHLKQVAEKEGRTMSGLIRVSLNKYLKEVKKWKKLKYTHSDYYQYGY